MTQAIAKTCKARVDEDAGCDVEALDPGYKHCLYEVHQMKAAGLFSELPLTVGTKELLELTPASGAVDHLSHRRKAFRKPGWYLRRTLGRGYDSIAMIYSSIRFRCRHKLRKLDCT